MISSPYKIMLIYVTSSCVIVLVTIFLDFSNRERMLYDVMLEYVFYL